MHNQTKNMSGESKQMGQMGETQMAQSSENRPQTNLNAESLNQNPYVNAQSFASSQKTQNQNLGQNPYLNTQNQMNLQTNQGSNLFDSIETKDFIKGALIGAGVTYLLTNENVQNSIMKVVAKGVSLFQSGVEEIKEKYEDAKAEIEAEKDEE